ncbi:MAG: hypothetical protein AAB641_01610 [Patescibacteria group bacterium]
MDTLRELLQVDWLTALNFFHEGLEEVAPKEIVGTDETMYVASVLAHFAQSSRCDTGANPSPATLLDIFDQFFWKDRVGTDPQLLETAGSSSLLLLGFWPKQMSQRHNLRWYTHLGRSFYARASRHCPERQKGELLKRLSSHFTIWTFSCQKFSKNLQEAPLLLH